MKHQCLKGIRTSFYDLETLMMDMVDNMTAENVEILNQVVFPFLNLKRKK